MTAPADHGRYIGVGLVLVSLCLLLLAWPVFWSALAASSADHIDRQVALRRDISDGQIDAYLYSRQVAVDRWATAENLSDLSVAQGMKAMSQDPIDRALLGQSMETTELVLQRRGVDPAAWLRMAALSRALDADDAQAVVYLRRAMETGAQSARLRSALAKQGLVLWRKLTPQDRASVMLALEVAWQYESYQRADILRLAQRQGLDALLDIALAGNDHSTERLNRLRARTGAN